MHIETISVSLSRPPFLPIFPPPSLVLFLSLSQTLFLCLHSLSLSLTPLPLLQNNNKQMKSFRRVFSQENCENHTRDSAWRHAAMRRRLLQTGRPSAPEGRRLLRRQQRHRASLPTAGRLRGSLPYRGLQLVRYCFTDSPSFP